MKRHSTKESEFDRPSISAYDKDLEHQYYLDELEYPSWYSRERLFYYLHSAPEDSMWNSFICVLVLAAIVWQVTEEDRYAFIMLADVLYNIIYALHVLGIAYNTFVTIEDVDVGMWNMLGFAIDFATFFHYVLIIEKQNILKSVCYFLRLHRPFSYLWELNGYNLNGSVLGASLKYIYIFGVLRVGWACMWEQLNELEEYYALYDGMSRALQVVQERQGLTSNATSVAAKFYSSLYVVNKMFIPIGPSVPPANDIERMVCLMIMISGCLIVTGAAVASLSLVISTYMRPEEVFRARYRLIMREMSETNVPVSLRQKVESFYRMYWHKQRAVSGAVLLNKFPPTLPTLIYTDIYFEATQRTRLLCNLKFEFLCELSKKMTTINYIPGDAIISRNSTKANIIFITYGDVEMLTAEDDCTPILRMTRGTVLSPCAGGVAAACARSHVTIMAASFCTAHVLHVADLWRVARKYGQSNLQNDVILDAFKLHFESVKKHYQFKFTDEAKFKSSILNFKNNLRRLRQVTDADGKLVLNHPELFLEIAKSYIMRNRTDSSTDESDAICLKSTFPCILQPDSSLQVAWQIVTSGFTLVAAVVIPYNVVFVATRSMEYEFFRTVIDVINVIDVIIHLSTGAHVEEGVPINFMQTSSQQLRSAWFFLDVAAILPIFYFVGEGEFDGINKLLKLPKVFRNLKSLEELFVYTSSNMRVLSFVLLVLIACYLIATMQQGFMCFQFDHCLVVNYTNAPFWTKLPLDDTNVESRLCFGLYWAISLMTFTTHLEVFGLEKWDNVIYTVILLEICTVMHIFIEAVYSATIMVTTFLRNDYESTISNVKNFMIRNDVDPQMRKRFITYLELCWYTDKAYSMTNKKKSIFFDLPPHVYQEIVSRKRSKYILNIPVMKFVPKPDLKNISTTARLYYTSPNEILMNTGDITNEMFVIKQGMCEVINPDTREVVSVLSAKGHFGVVECLLRLPTYYTVRAVTHVQVFSISKKKVEKLLEIPQIKYAVKFAKGLPEYKNLQLRRESFLFFEPPKPAPNRERFRLPKKYEQDTIFLQPFTRLGFLAVLRYVFPRFTIRPDGKYLQRYELFRSVCALMTAMLCTCYTYLVLQWPSLYYVLLILDMTAYYDIVQRLLIGYYNEMGILVYHPAATSAYYLKGTFIVDLMASIPLEFLETEHRFYNSEQKLFTRSTIRQMLMMNRLLQMYRLPGAINSLTTYIQRRDIHLVIHALPFFLTLLNVLTCSVIFNSVNIYTTAKSSLWRIVPFPDHGGSWVDIFGNTFRFNITETPWNLHLASYFWVVYATTTTGYSCFHPTNYNLMTVFFIGMVVGTTVVTYFSVSIISIRANVNKELAGYQEDLRDMIKFMHREELDKTLQKEVLSYYEYNWDKMGGVDYNRVLKLCDQMTLRTDAILHIYGPTFSKCPFLMKCDISLLRIVGREVHSVYLLRNMHIFDVDDVIQDLYFLVYGQVQIRVFYADRSMVAKLHRGSVFGNLDQIAMVRSQSTAVAQSRVHILQIKTYNFHRILADFPRVHRTMAKCRANNKNFIANTGATALQQRGTRDRISIYGSVFLRGRRGLIKHLYFKDKIIQIYLILVSLICIYLDIYNAGFQNNSIALIIFLYLLDFLFYMKILIQYSLPYVVNTENLRRVLAPLRRNYFKGDFKYDLISCLPIELFSLADHKNRWMIFSWLRLNRLLRIVTVYKCLVRHHERLNINLTLTTIATVLIWFTVFIHGSSCLWYFIGVMQDQQKPKSSWIHKLNGNGTWCRNYYICSTYFTLTTFSQNGVGDILPRNHAEVMFVCVFQIISMMMYMVYVGEFSNIIQYQSFRSFGYYCKFLELQHYLANNRVSKNLVDVVNKYALHLWREARGLQVPHFLANAPPAIKLRVMSAAYMAHLENHIVFEACEPAFLRQLVGKLKMYYFNRDMSIVNEGEITDTMYIVHTGRVQESSSGSVTSRTIIAGGSFGLIEGLFPETPFRSSYKSILKCQILMLTFSDWMSLLAHFPKSADSIYERLDFDDGYGPHIPPKFDKSYQCTPWQETEFPEEDVEKPTEMKTKFTATRRQSTPFGPGPLPLGLPTFIPKDIRQQESSQEFSTERNNKSSTSNSPSELELTNISLSEKTVLETPSGAEEKAKTIKTYPKTERADVQSIQAIKFDESSGTTTTDPSTVAETESLQGSVELDVKKKVFYNEMEREESVPILPLHGQDEIQGRLDDETGSVTELSRQGQDANLAAMNLFGKGRLDDEGGSKLELSRQGQGANIGTMNLADKGRLDDKGGSIIELSRQGQDLTDKGRPGDEGGSIIELSKLKQDDENIGTMNLADKGRLDDEGGSIVELSRQGQDADIGTMNLADKSRPGDKDGSIIELSRQEQDANIETINLADKGRPGDEGGSITELSRQGQDENIGTMSLVDKGRVDDSHPVIIEELKESEPAAELSKQEQDENKGTMNLADKGRVDDESGPAAELSKQDQDVNKASMDLVDKGRSDDEATTTTYVGPLNSRFSDNDFSIMPPQVYSPPVVIEELKEEQSEEQYRKEISKEPRTETGKESKKETGEEMGITTGKETGTETDKEASKETSIETGTEIDKEPRTETGIETSKEAGEKNSKESGKETRMETAKETGEDTGPETSKERDKVTVQETRTGTGEEADKESSKEAGKETAKESGQETRIQTGAETSTGIDKRTDHEADKQTGKEVTIDKDKINAVEYEVQNDDDIDQGDMPDMGTAAARITRRLIHVRYEEDHKKPGTDTPQPPEQDHDEEDKEGPSTSKDKKT